MKPHLTVDEAWRGYVICTKFMTTKVEIGTIYILKIVQLRSKLGQRVLKVVAFIDLSFFPLTFFMKTQS